jgi:hypothetical protein
MSASLLRGHAFSEPAVAGAITPNRGSPAYCGTLHQQKKGPAICAGPKRHVIQRIQYRGAYFFGGKPDPVPVLAVSCTMPLSQAEVNSACDSFPSLLASTALKSAT